MPEAYLDSLMIDESMDEATFFALNGCPYFFMKVMFRLANLASTLKHQMLMDEGPFDMDQVDSLVKVIKGWTNNNALSIDEIEKSTEDFDDKMDRYHCIEAWRYAIVLYCRRVFRLYHDATDLRVIDRFTRVILDHIRCIRKLKMIQKQVLLPLFLAAVETEDDFNRDFVRSYCMHWSRTARYSQFETALAWIESIWTHSDVLGRDIYWWGCNIDDQTWSGEDDSDGLGIQKELLLG